MKTEEISWNDIRGFISMMDTSMPKEVHIVNAVRDNWMYGWNASTFSALIKGINDAYFKLGEL